MTYWTRILCLCGRAHFTVSAEGAAIDTQAGLLGMGHFYFCLFGFIMLNLGFRYI